VPRRMKEAPAGKIGPYRVVSVSQIDGTKLLLENDNWVLLRFSGTEPVLRLTVEADSPEKARELIEWLRQFASAENAGAAPGALGPRAEDTKTKAEAAHALRPF
jgi:phosphomannomutase